MDHDFAHRFRETGAVRADGAFTSAEATDIREVVWRHIEERSAVRYGRPETWSAASAGSFGLSSLVRRPEFAAVTQNPSVRDALRTIFDGEVWEALGFKVLLTFPEKAAWVMPRGWHVDFGLERPTWPAFAVKIFAFFDTVEPEGGGTLVMEGSHRLHERFAAETSQDLASPAAHHELMHKHKWVERVVRGGRAAHPMRELIGEWNDVDGIPLRVTELTGRPGDVVLTHMHVLHSPAPNAGTRPRQMLGVDIGRTESIG